MTDAFRPRWPRVPGRPRSGSAPLARLVVDPVAADRSPVDDQGHAVVHVGELDLMASRALDRRLPCGPARLSPRVSDGGSGRQVDRAAMRRAPP